MILPSAARQPEVHKEEVRGSERGLVSETRLVLTNFSICNCYCLLSWYNIEPRVVKMKKKITCREVKGVTSSCLLPPCSTLLLFSGGSLLLPLLLGVVVRLFFTLGFLLLEPGGLPGPRFTTGVGPFSSFFFGAGKKWILVLETFLKISGFYSKKFFRYVETY